MPLIVYELMTHVRLIIYIRITNFLFFSQINASSISDDCRRSKLKIMSSVISDGSVYRNIHEWREQRWKINVTGKKYESGKPVRARSALMRITYVSALECKLQRFFCQVSKILRVAVNFIRLNRNSLSSKFTPQCTPWPVASGWATTGGGVSW